MWDGERAMATNLIALIYYLWLLHHGPVIATCIIYRFTVDCKLSFLIWPIGKHVASRGATSHVRIGRLFRSRSGNNGGRMSCRMVILEWYPVMARRHFGYTPPYQSPSSDSFHDDLHTRNGILMISPNHVQIMWPLVYVVTLTYHSRWREIAMSSPQQQTTIVKADDFLRKSSSPISGYEMAGKGGLGGKFRSENSLGKIMLGSWEGIKTKEEGNKWF